jgi:hypothetical protein
MAKNRDVMELGIIALKIDLGAVAGASLQTQVGVTEALPIVIRVLRAVNVIGADVWPESLRTLVFLEWAEGHIELQLGDVVQR